MTEACPLITGVVQSGSLAVASVLKNGAKLLKVLCQQQPSMFVLVMPSVMPRAVAVTLS